MTMTTEQLSSRAGLDTQAWGQLVADYLAGPADPVVGWLTVEFDVAGRPLADGVLYTDRDLAHDIVDRRNAAEGDPELLERWFVLAVRAETADARQAAQHAERVAAGFTTGQTS
jgi:hypothetical protein